MADPVDVIARAIEDAWWREHRPTSVYSLNIARAALSALEGEGMVVGKGWKPIETAPKDGTLIWLGSADLRCLRLGRWLQERWADDARHQASIVHPQRCDILFEPTHWMEIPLPPEPR